MILVTGGTGLVGSHLLFHLAQSGEKVRAIYRTPNSLNKVLTVFGYYSDTPERLLHAITWVQADLTDIAALRPLFKDVDQVYHCAALISFDPNDYNTLVKINVEGTANIVNLCLVYGVTKLCHVSSIAALHSDTKDKEVTEATAWSNHHASVYGSTKHRAELEVWRGAQEGLPVVIVNPGVIIGPGFWDRGSGKLFTYTAQGKNYFPPGGTGFVSVNDVVRAMVLLMASKVTQERFILVSENCSYREVLQEIALALEMAPPVKKIPFWVLEGVWRIDGLWSKLSRKKRRLTKTMVKGLYQQKVYCNHKLKNTLLFEFEALDAVLDFCGAEFKKEREKLIGISGH